MRSASDWSGSTSAPPTPTSPNSPGSPPPSKPGGPRSSPSCSCASPTPEPVAEVRRLRLALALERGERANLLAAAQAAIAAHHDGEPDPLAYLHDELDTRTDTPAA